MSNAYDLIVIGAGPAGQSAAELATFLGHSVLVVERSTPGGVVATTGGAPTKTLREIALDVAREFERDGHRLRLPGSDTLDVLRRRTLDVCRTLQATIARQLEARGIHHLQGAATLTPSRPVAVSGSDGERREVSARAIVLATGSRPLRAADVPFDDPDIYDSNEIFSMRRLPDDIVIVGGGPVGVEFTTIFSTLGVPVTLVD